MPPAQIYAGKRLFIWYSCHYFDAIMQKKTRLNTNNKFIEIFSYNPFDRILILDFKTYFKV